MVHKTNLVAAALLAVLVLLTYTTNSFGLDNNKKSSIKATTNAFPERGIKNLIKGLESDNEGLKRSSIYFAGVYELKELVEPLVNQMSKEKDADTRILIALALYKIGDEAGLKAIQNILVNDDNKVVRLMVKSLFRQLSEDGASFSVTKN